MCGATLSRHRRTPPEKGPAPRLPIVTLRLCLEARRLALITAPVRDRSPAERSELAAVQRALRRLADGRYGLCRDCRQVLPAEELLAVPEAERCAACAARRGRRRGPPCRCH
jgi:hypothetical protein